MTTPRPDDAAGEGVEADVDLLDPITDHYAMIPNAVLRDHGISTDARAILCEWLSHTKTWKYDLQRTASENGITRERTRRAVKELRNAGYVHFIKVSKGRSVFTQRYRVGNRRGATCNTPGCQDCRIGTPKSLSRTDQAKQDVSAGHFGTTIYESRKSSSQDLEDHQIEDQEDLSGPVSSTGTVVARTGAHATPDAPAERDAPRPTSPEREIFTLSDSGAKVAVRLAAAGVEASGAEIEALAAWITTRADDAERYLSALDSKSLRRKLEEIRGMRAGGPQIDRQQVISRPAASLPVASVMPSADDLSASECPRHPGEPVKCRPCAIERGEAAPRRPLVTELAAAPCDSPAGGAAANVLAETRRKLAKIAADRAHAERASA